MAEPEATLRHHVSRSTGATASFEALPTQAMPGFGRIPAAHVEEPATGRDRRSRIRELSREAMLHQDE